MFRLNSYLLSPEAAEGNTTTPETPTVGKPESQESALAILAKKNAELERDNLRYRERERKNKEAASQTPPSPGLKPEDASDLEAYRSFGKPGDIRTLQEEREALLREASSLKRDATLRSVADEVEGNASVLKLAAAAHPDMQFIAVEVKDKNGKPKKVLHVHTGEEKPVPFAERFPELMPAFKPGGEVPVKVPGTPPRGLQATGVSQFQPTQEDAMIRELKANGAGSF